MSRIKLSSLVLVVGLGPSALGAPPLDEGPSEEVAKETAAKFFDAIGRDDDTEAQRYVLGPADCEDIAARTRKMTPVQVATCREQLKDDPAQVVSMFHKVVPAGFVTGKMEVVRNSPAPGADLVYAAAKKGDAKTSCMIAQLGTRLRIVVGKRSK